MTNVKNGKLLSQTALIVIDLQKDFFDPRSIGAMAKAVCLPGVRKLLEHSRGCNWTIIHVETIHDAATSIPLHLQNLRKPSYCMVGTDGAESLPDIRNSD